MEWSDAIMWVLAVAVPVFGTPVMGILVTWLKSLSIVKKMQLESLIDGAAEIAVNYAEAWGRKVAAGGGAKLEAAKVAFQEELAKYGVKMDAGSMEKRLEAIFNKLKCEIEDKPIEGPKINIGGGDR